MNMDEEIKYQESNWTEKFNLMLALKQGLLNVPQFLALWRTRGYGMADPGYYHCLKHCGSTDPNQMESTALALMANKGGQDER